MKSHFFKYFAITLLGLFVSCNANDGTKNQDRKVAAPLPEILNMVHINPGEGDTESIYNDPNFVKTRGFTGMVGHWNTNCAITYDNFEKDIVPIGSEERKWIETLAATIDKKMDECERAGMDVYAFTDVFMAPASIWQRYGDEMGVQETDFDGYGGDVANVRKPNIQRPMIQKLLIAQVEGMFERFPSLDGLVIRFGETYLHDAPNHMGGELVRQGEEGIKMWP